MKPVEFKNQNIVYGKDQKEFEGLPAMVTAKAKEAIQYWEFNDEEIKDIVQGKTKGIFVSQLIGGRQLQPILLSVDDLTIGKTPYIFPKKKKTNSDAKD